MLAEVFWRRLRALPPVDTNEPSAKVRVVSVLTELALLVSGEPELAEGCTAAGSGSPCAGLLELGYFGAMVQAGLGYSTYGRVADRLAEAVELIMR